VIAVRDVMIAIAKRPPKIGKPSIQLACARANRCINGVNPSFSRVKPFAATLPVSTRKVQMPSINSSSNSIHATKPVRA
jgi:hypothetical protein